MQPFQLILVSVLGLVVLVALVGLQLRSSLLAKAKACDAAWTDVESTLELRHILMGNLVERARESVVHDRDKFVAVTEARNHVHFVEKRGTIHQRVVAENALDRAVAALLDVAALQPAIQATPAFADLRSELGVNGAQVSEARQRYNALATSYNRAIRSRSRRYIAAPLHLVVRQLFEMSAATFAPPIIS
jgi:LemA protein